IRRPAPGCRREGRDAQCSPRRDVTGEDGGGELSWADEGGGARTAVHEDDGIPGEVGAGDSEGEVRATAAHRGRAEAGERRGWRGVGWAGSGWGWCGGG